MMDSERKKGLTSGKAKERLKEFGLNEIAKKKRWVGLKILLSQFTSPLVYVLLFAVVVTLFLKDYIDAGVIMMAVVLNTILGFFQEYRAEKSIEALKKVLDPKAKVRRDGEWQLIQAKEIVPGDVVFLSDEHKVPADGILLQEDGLHINEAVLTGESAPVEKFDYEGGEEEWDKLLDSFDKVEGKYKAFMGTEVKSGVGQLLVVRTGGQTETGKVASLLKEAPGEETPLQTKVRKLSTQLAVLVGVVSVLVLVLGLMVGDSFEEIFPTAVALAVASIPEGLAISLTVVLAIGSQRILSRKAVIRKLTAAETLGSVDVICADKTGTLTTGEMKVTGSVTELSGEGKKEKEMMLAAILANDMRDPLEIGMNEWAVGLLGKGEDRGVIRKTYGRVDSIPFSSVNRYIATLHKAVKGEQWLFVSGAPEIVLRHAELSAEEKKSWESKFSEMGSKGYRLVGFGYKKIKGKVEKKKIKPADLEKIEWLGILLYEDPIRMGVKEILPQVQKAGIKVKVITGDYKETSVAVLRQLGLLDERNEGLVMEGKELEKFKGEELDRKIEETILFARTTPQQKLIIVEALKKMGHVVAMTGDGVNDAPALKLADIGIVVNEASEVSKETADLVLLDNNFETIVAAIEEGRGIYENFRKIIVYLLADAFAGIILILAGILLGWPLPLLAVQILWINLISDGFPNLALTVEPKESGLLQRPPRERGSRLIDGEVLGLISLISVSAAVVTLAAFWGYWRGDSGNLEMARTVAFAMLGVCSLSYVFSSRSVRPIWEVNIFRNWWLIGAVGLGLGLQILVTYLPTLQVIFRTVALGMSEWLLIGVSAVGLLLVIEGFKFAYVRR